MHGGGNVDSDTKAYLLEMKQDIVSEVGEIVEKANQQLEEHITQINHEKFKSVEKDLDRHDRWHDDHFEATKKIDEKITKSRESMMREIQDKSRFGLSTIISIVAVLAAVGAIFIVVI